MATHFERQLEELHVQIITMGSLCEKAISLSNRAIRGDKCIQEIFDTDKEIDAKEREIENLCMRILLHQQPVARDLREVSAALKMISDGNTNGNSLEKNVCISSSRMTAPDSVSLPRLDNPTGACPTHRRQWADFLVSLMAPLHRQYKTARTELAGICY